ncbi:MAG: Inner membrane protein YrbG, predicted calcium/sodium:proton antiporter [uncultured Thiotrichaceae bacterium]|uniref:Inner membrane protein YrbG, predicted calcium/sodium:proton antiporter n=1 Tax=uncultured Thiotrichaceae bacterium TaxID=298394 RepID=A0A6S6UJE1_9GAMM|nr:MAG: Inner membrane protein YrbG, predicted calcium/sodium:proton antiporter [uncultured Thiotrichaceae bacterium]
MLIIFSALLIGMLVLIWSADKFVDGAAGLARHMGISPLLVGMLVVGFGTSAPEMLVSTVAALQGSPGLGIGNAIGSNITNIGLVLGVTAIIVNLPIYSRVLKIELPIILFSGIAVYFLMINGDGLSQLDGWILATSLVVTMSILTYLSVNSPAPILAAEACAELPKVLPLKSSILWTLAGLVLLITSSKMLVWSATQIAHMLGVSDLVIGLTIVAIGTSLPELAAAITSALKKETDFAVGTIIGSNIFNTLGVLAIPAIIGVSHIPEGVMDRDMPIMLGITALLLLLSIGFWQRFKITRKEGVILLGCFIGYQVLLYKQTIGTA